MTTQIETLKIPSGRNESRERSLADFSQVILELNKEATQKMSSRGWCYFIEGFNLISKGEFGKVQNAINECRKKGYLPIDFVAEDPKRTWMGVEDPDSSPEDYLRQWLEGIMKAEEYYTPDWWAGEKYYLQMMVEKIDLVNMFSPICAKYHIPIVNAGGWYDIMERGIAAKRFSAAEEKGLTPVILYFGDFDPFGLAISKFIKSNFVEIYRGTRWDPSSLIVDRFGLNYEFIEKEHLTWIENLESGSGRDMSTDDNSIVQEYMKRYGIRKCEANAVMRASARPSAIKLCQGTIESYLGRDALKRFESKRKVIRRKMRKLRKESGIDKTTLKALKYIKKLK